MTTDVLSPAASGFEEPPNEPDDHLDHDLLCLDTYLLTHDVRSFVLEVPPAVRLGFDPGQYLTLRVDVDGAPLERCYTISSSPTRPERVTITVKRVPDGPVSNWLHDHVGIGDRLHVRGPLGLFSSHRHPAAKYLFLSAGSGITPADVDDPGPAGPPGRARRRVRARRADAATTSSSATSSRRWRPAATGWA